MSAHGGASTVTRVPGTRGLDGSTRDLPDPPAAARAVLRAFPISTGTSWTTAFEQALPVLALEEPRLVRK